MNRPVFKQFHHFIQLAANRAKQAQKISEFQYMQDRIRKQYKQLKKTHSDKNTRPCQKFVQFFKSLQKQDQIKFYQRWLNNLQYAIGSKFQVQKLKQQISSMKKQGQIFIKTSILNKWQKKQIKIENLTFFIHKHKKIKAYPLKNYIIRKSKNKQLIGWVLQVINDRSKIKLKNLHCGVRNNKQFDQWYQFLQKCIELSRIEHFRREIFNDLQSLQIKNDHDKNMKINPNNMKTMTELVIDNHMRVIQQTEIDVVIQQQKNHQNKKQMKSQKTIKQQKHPNVFQRLFPQNKLNFFTHNNQYMTLLESGQGYRIFELTSNSTQNFKMRINIMLPFNKSLVFRALNQETIFWNNQIDIFSIKTKISSQNSALIYQKDKSQGLLYRQRDYLYFRHCFSQKATDSTEKNKIFIADKSIDSINFPPFMSVVRGQKNLVWCICGNQQDNQSMLIVQGNIKGGGYMNITNDKQMTIKFYKKLLGLEHYLKQKKFVQGKTKVNQHVFQQNWQVLQQQQFYDIDQDLNQSFQSCSSEQIQQNNNSKKQQDTKKTNGISDPQIKQFEQFIKKTSEQNIQMSLSQVRSSQKLEVNQGYVPPPIAQDKTVIIPQKYLKTKHRLVPYQKQNNSSWYPHIRGHHLWKGQWAICPAGGLNYVDQQKMNQQKKVLTFIIKRIGRNILSGKGILNISLPVDIFCRQSNIQRLAASFGYAPVFLQKAALLPDPTQQLKYIIASGCFSSLIYLTMQKPFNPILGQTYQAWIDGCPVYFQQISHHPPIAAYLMIGRGYKISGSLQAKMDLSINSGTGVNQGIFTVEFDNGKKFYYTTPAGQLSGLTYGERKLIFVGKSYYWNIQDGLFLEFQFNPSSKNRRFFGGGNQGSGDSQLHDYFQGTVKKYRKQDLEAFLTPKKGDTRQIILIPKSLPPSQPISQVYKVSGRWTKYISFNGQKKFDVDENRYLTMKDQQNPLASHSNYRQDIVYRRLNNCVQSQQFKEVLEISQRKDKKLRQLQQKKRK